MSDTKTPRTDALIAEVEQVGTAWPLSSCKFRDLARELERENIAWREASTLLHRRCQKAESVIAKVSDDLTEILRSPMAPFDSFEAALERAKKKAQAALVTIADVKLGLLPKHQDTVRLDHHIAHMAKHGVTITREAIDESIEAARRTTT